MNKVKRWIPPVAPASNNLASWKAICLDIHNNLLDAGLVQTVDTGQLDFDTVEVMPANGSFVGYRVYRWDDVAQATSPIFLKIEFGAGYIGVANSNSAPLMPRFRTNFGTETDGAGGGLLTVSTHMQTYNPSGSDLGNFIFSPGTSLYSRNDDLGFFGFAYAIGAVERPAPSSYGIKTGLMCFFVQRDAGGGFSTICPWNSWGQLASGTTYRQAQHGANYTFIDSNGVTASVRTAAPRPLSLPIFNPDDSVNFSPVYATDSQRNIKQWPSLVTYHSELIPAGSEFDLEVVQGETKTFVALGDGIGMGTDQIELGSGSFAMIWEDDG